ncbi:MAG TPA: DsrE family protein [Gallionellaceae bacterium]
MKFITLSQYIASIFVLSFALSITPAQAGDNQTSVAGHEKVVFQVSDADPKKWNLALNNAKNAQEALGAANVDVEIVVYGPGIAMLKFDSTVASRIDEAKDAGIKVVACENTMKSQNLTHNDMLSSIGYVPAGVIELMHKQKEGYAYIRP